MSKQHDCLSLLGALLAGLLVFPPSALQAQRANQRTRGLTGGGAGGGLGARQYPNNTMLGDALIEVDPETRSIIVITDDDTKKYISEVIKQLDQPKPQVLIKVVFVEVTLRNNLNLGAEGSVTGTRNDGKTQGTLESIFGAAAETQGGFARLMNDDFQVVLHAAAEEGKLEVLSRPSILARNNQEAIITVGKEVPFIQNTRFLQDGQQVNTVQYSDIGIILRVTPFITKDGFVEMIVAPEISTITDETLPISAGIEAPVFAKRSAETVVVTPHATTVVIGGMMEKNKTESIRKIPILGDIPLLGWAFRHKVSEDTKTELLIFLTPYIVKDPMELKALTARERGQTKATGRAFSEEDLKRFLDNPPPPEPALPKKPPKKKRRFFFWRKS